MEGRDGEGLGRGPLFLCFEQSGASDCYFRGASPKWMVLPLRNDNGIVIVMANKPMHFTESGHDKYELADSAMDGLMDRMADFNETLTTDSFEYVMDAIRAALDECDVQAL